MNRGGAIWPTVKSGPTAQPGDPSLLSCASRPPGPTSPAAAHLPPLSFLFPPSPTGGTHSSSQNSSYFIADSGRVALGLDVVADPGSLSLIPSALALLIPLPLLDLLPTLRARFRRQDALN